MSSGGREIVETLKCTIQITGEKTAMTICSTNKQKTPKKTARIHTHTHTPPQPRTEIP